MSVRVAVATKNAPATKKASSADSLVAMNL